MQLHAGHQAGGQTPGAPLLGRLLPRRAQRHRRSPLPTCFLELPKPQVNHGPQGLRALPGALCLPPLRRTNKDEAEATSFLPGCRRPTESAFGRAGLSQAHSGTRACLLTRAVWTRFTGGSGGERHPGPAFLQTSPTAPQSRTGALAQGESPRSPPEASSPPPVPGLGRKLESGWARPALRGQHREAGRELWRAGSPPAQPGRRQERVRWGASGPADTHTPPWLRSPPLARGPPCPCCGDSCNEKKPCAWNLPARPRPQGPALGSVPCGAGSSPPSRETGSHGPPGWPQTPAFPSR